MDKPEGFERLKRALSEIDERLISDMSEDQEEIENNIPGNSNQKLYQPEVMTTIHQAYDSEPVELALTDAIGCASAEFIIPYPPGIPLLVPGEKIDSHIVDTIKSYRQKGLTINGLTENGNIQVCEEVEVKSGRTK
jgi:arginine/lysine/ornithine decarboxylase